MQVSYCPSRLTNGEPFDAQGNISLNPVNTLENQCVMQVSYCPCRLTNGDPFDAQEN